jgi:hypothetical protein
MDPMNFPVSGESSPSPTSWLENKPIQKQMMMTNKKQQEDPHALAIQGDWRAYLDERSGMVYYFNTRTGLSQWDPPNINFPGISLKSFGGKQMAQIKQDQSKSKTPENNLVEVAGVAAGFSALGSALRKLFSDITEGSKNFQRKPPQNNQNNSNWWSSLFQGSEKLSANSSERASTKSQNLLISANDQDKEQGRNRRRTSENLYDWLDFAFSRDSTRTRTLIRNQHAVRDKESLRLKRLNDHYNRQENLRRTYEPVTVDRSPTFSLTRIKKSSSNKNEWLKYLD